MRHHFHFYWLRSKFYSTHCKHARSFLLLSSPLFSSLSPPWISLNELVCTRTLNRHLHLGICSWFCIWISASASETELKFIVWLLGSHMIHTASGYGSGVGSKPGFFFWLNALIKNQFRICYQIPSVQNQKNTKPNILKWSIFGIICDSDFK